jgi:predicted RNA-binding protein YlxR (DUF448 family)
LPRRDEHLRTCIVTRETGPVDGLIRFVVAPDGAVVPDLRRRLPGRGVYVTATAANVVAAEKKKLLARAFEGPARVEPGLADRIDELLATGVMAALSMARKAGEVVSGYAKVESALREGKAIGLIHAAEAAADGSAKLDGLARHGNGGELPVIRSFTGAQLDLAFGGSNVIHAALLAGPASSNVLNRYHALLRYRGGGPEAGSRFQTELTDISAGS